MKSKIAQNLSYRSFLNFGSKRDSPLQINCENFIIGCTVGFRAILDQRQVFTTLDENWIAHALYLRARSCDTMYHVLELFMKLFCHDAFNFSNVCKEISGSFNLFYTQKLLLVILLHYFKAQKNKITGEDYESERERKDDKIKNGIHGGK